MFRQDFTCPALLKSFIITFAYGAVTRYGHSFQSVLLVEMKALAWSRVRSPLLTGISVDVFSSRY